MKALVTGGGGFLGRYIVERLREQRSDVRVLSRRRYVALDDLGCESIVGDVRDMDAVSAACEGVDIVFHVAALAGYWGRRENFYTINVDGTRNVIQACRRHRVGKLIYTSSPSAVFGSESLAGVDESQPYPDRYLAHYPASKAAAEQLVLQANGHDGLATCALRPHLIWGPRDTHIVPLLAQRARSGKLIRIGKGQNTVDVTYVENAAEAHILAAEALSIDSPVGGQAYFIGDSDPVLLWQWIDDLLKELRLPTVTKSLSYAAAYRLGGIMEGAYTILPLPGQPRITRFVVNSFALSHYFDQSRARRDLKYIPRVSLEEGLKRTAEWYRKSIDEQ